MGHCAGHTFRQVVSGIGRIDEVLVLIKIRNRDADHRLRRLQA